METFEQDQSVSELKEMRKGVAEKQTALYGDALVRLMERSNDNSELVNALRDFVKEVDLKSWRGEADKPMTEGYVNRLTAFFKEKTEELKILT